MVNRLMTIFLIVLLIAWGLNRLYWIGWEHGVQDGIAINQSQIQHMFNGEFEMKGAE